MRGDAKFPKFVWTDDAVATLRQMAADYSAKTIGERLGTTRNAVIGKCLRTGISLTGTDKPERAQVYRKPTPRRSPAPPKSPARKLECHIPSSSFARKGSYRTFPAAAPDEVAAIAVERQHVREAVMTAETAEWRPLRIPFLQTREGQCRWPLWKGSAPFHAKFVCGLPAPVGKPYCPRCRALAYAPPRQTKQQDDKLGITAARKAA